LAALGRLRRTDLEQTKMRRAPVFTAYSAIPQGFVPDIEQWLVPEISNIIDRHVH
jgi:hypothetical protein